MERCWAAERHVQEERRRRLLEILDANPEKHRAVKVWQGNPVIIGIAERGRWTVELTVAPERFDPFALMMDLLGKHE
jgi:hypothetical protein